MHNKTVSAWHIEQIQNVLEHWQTDAAQGLSLQQAQQRLSQQGYNRIAQTDDLAPWALFFSQFKNPLMLMLGAGALLSVGMGQVLESLAIVGIIVFSAGLGFLQEWRAGKSLESLRQMAAPWAWVLRQGQRQKILAECLVCGDILLLEPGDKVPADARLIESVNLKVEESVLTGESIAVEKSAAFVGKKEDALPDQINMVFAGTSIVYGRGHAVVVATGMQTQFGRIAALLQNVKPEQTPLQKYLERLSKILTRGALAIVFIIILAGYLHGENVWQMVIFGIALAVAVVPEALPAVVTISLSIGVRRMVKRNALMRHLPAVETLGCSSVICSDKTGTLTQDQMTVRKILLGVDQEIQVSGNGYNRLGSFSLRNADYDPSPAFKFFMQAATLCNDATLSVNGTAFNIKGDATEAALLVCAAKAGIDKETLDKTFPRLEEIPFSSETKNMFTRHASAQGSRVFCKGAPEIILKQCAFYQTIDGICPLDDATRQRILERSALFAQSALRVLAGSYCLDTKIHPQRSDMIFLGLWAMMDPPRPQVKAALDLCRQGHIRVIMMTGDHPITALAIAKELGLSRNDADPVLCGTQIANATDAQLDQWLETTSVCARLAPEHKLRLVESLQRQSYVVAMTGDGVNDAPAIKRADVGIAMGQSGTQVSRQAAAMILLDDNFASIVAAIEEGRVIFNNIKKYLMYLLSSNIGEILLMAAAAVLSLPLPLSALQILYVNLATDGLPALALALDPAEKNVMQKFPRRIDQNIFDSTAIVFMLIGGVWSALVNVGLFIYALHSGHSIKTAMTMVFIALVSIQLVKAYGFRSLDRWDNWRQNFNNFWLNAAVAWELLLLLLLLHVPYLRQMFDLAHLKSVDLGLCLLSALSFIPVFTIAKYIRAKKLCC